MSDLLEELNDAQRKAVTHETGPLLIVAGAGTGKTTVLTRRYAYLLETKKLHTEQILALTFTEKAAGEMEDRVLQLLPNGTYDFWISTFHGFCQRVLEKYAFEIGLPNQFRVVNETDAWLLLKRRFEELPLDHYRPLGNPLKFLGGLLRHFSRAKDEGVTPESYLAFAETAVLDADADPSMERSRLKEIADCFFAYRRILREEGALDFGDLITETLRLLRERPRVLKELQDQFAYVFVDEFQDTNWAQYELIKMLAAPKNNVTVVGDDDQAIYKFRGASLANILQFRDDYPDAATVALTQNYRSHQEILDTSYGFIQKNDPNRLEVRLASTGLSKRLVSATGPGGVVSSFWYKSLEDEAEAVAIRIRGMKEENPELSWNDFAILSRSNDGCEPFVFALERHGIPFRFIAMRGLYAKPAIVDLTAIFSLLDGYRESSAVWRAMTAPCFSFSPGEMAEFLHFAARKTGGTLWDAVSRAREIPGMIPEAVQRTESFVTVIQRLSETAHRERPLRLLQLILEKTSYLSEILKRPEREKLEMLGHLNAFANRIKRYESSTLAPTVKGFMEEFRMEIDSGEEGALMDEADAGPEAVSVMTVHASKGLEFSHVFIVSLVDQRFPTRVRGESIPLPDGLVNERLPEGDAHIEEERRLFYVAMTRAKKSLFLTGAESYGGTRKKKPSVFLSEAGVASAMKEVNSQAEKMLLIPTMTDRESAEREVFPLKRRFSFTQLAAFQKCPLQYKFSHVYRIPILGSYQKSYGQSIHLSFHDILSLHLERGQVQQSSLFGGAEKGSDEIRAALFRVTLNEALAIFETRWIDEWYPTRAIHDEHKQQGRDAVRRMHEEWSVAPPDVAFLEQPFDWRIGEHSIKGSVDRIDRLESGGHVIFDYKTGEAKTSEDLERDQKEQLWIYQIAMEGRGLDIRRLAYVYLRTGGIADVPILQGEKRDAFREELKGRMDAILASRFPPAASSFVCRYCDFRNICEFRKL